MGNKNTYVKKVHLSQDEINTISNSNSTLQSYFNMHKDASGFISRKSFENIFDKKVNSKISKNLYKIISNEKDKFNFPDFKYLYSLLYTKNYEAKLNFFADLIFLNKNIITRDNYIKKLKLYFNDFPSIHEKLYSENFITNMTNSNKIMRDNFIKNLDSQHKTLISTFSFILPKEEPGKPEVHEDGCKLILSSNNTACECIKNGISNKKNTLEIKTSTVSY
jgi:hypothetical protein